VACRLSPLCLFSNVCANAAAVLSHVPAALVCASSSIVVTSSRSTSQGPHKRLLRRTMSGCVRVVSLCLCVCVCDHHIALQPVAREISVVICVIHTCVTFINVYFPGRRVSLG